MMLVYCIQDIPLPIRECFSTRNQKLGLQ